MQECFEFSWVSLFYILIFARLGWGCWRQRQHNLRRWSQQYNFREIGKVFNNWSFNVWNSQCQDVGYLTQHCSLDCERLTRYILFLSGCFGGGGWSRPDSWGATRRPRSTVQCSVPLDLNYTHIVNLHQFALYATFRNTIILNHPRSRTFSISLFLHHWRTVVVGAPHQPLKCNTADMLTLPIFMTGGVLRMSHVNVYILLMCREESWDYRCDHNGCSILFPCTGQGKVLMAVTQFRFI